MSQQMQVFWAFVGTVLIVLLLHSIWQAAPL